MPASERFLAALKGQGYDYFAGVPCSLLKGVIRRFDEDPSWEYVSAVREDTALGLAAGAHLGGRKPAVLLQNSGLGVCLNALVSLHQIYELPALLVTTWRGRDGQDAPEHVVMGLTMERLLNLYQIPWRLLTRENVADCVEEITGVIGRERRPGALVVPKGVLDASR